MKSLFVAAIAVAGLGMAAPAVAQAQTTSTTTTTTATSGDPSLTSPRVYMNLGYTYLNPYKHDLGEVTGRAGAQFGRFWGAEMEIGGGVIGNHFANGPTINQRVNMSEGIQTSVYGVGFLPLMNDRVQLLGRVGYGQTPITWKSDANPRNLSVERSLNAMSWNYGVGAQFLMNGRDGIRVDWTRRDFQAKGFDNPKDTDAYSVALVHRF